jgi:hypothetical protein
VDAMYRPYPLGVPIFESSAIMESVETELS